MRCGPIVVQTIAQCLDVTLSDEQADKLCLLNGDGTSPSGLLHAFKELGLRFSSIIYDARIDHLESIIKAGGICAVVYLDGAGKLDGHWSIARHFNEQNVVLYDPDCGIRLMPMRHFDNVWYDYIVREGSWILLNRTAVVGYPPEGKGFDCL